MRTSASFAGLWILCLAIAASAAGLPAPIDADRSFAATLTAAGDGEVHRVELQLRLAGAAWDREGQESAVLALSIDGHRDQEIVVLDARRDYALLVGPLAAGAHQLELRLDASKSPAADAVVTVERLHTSAALGAAAAHAPILIGRRETRGGKPLSAASDTPLVLFVEQERRAHGLRLRYSVIWSNEDGGTGLQPPQLLAHWGRTTDIEWIYAVDLEFGVDLDGSGDAGPHLATPCKVVAATYQSRGHGTAEFRGERLGQHPILLVATANNTLSDAPGDLAPGDLITRMAPQLVERPSPREQVMDANPWCHRVASQELSREYELGMKVLGLTKLESPGRADTPTVSDARNYLYVDLHLEGRARWSCSVQLADGTTCRSDHGRALLRYRRSGWGRTAIELPPGTTPAQITSLTLEAHDLPANDSAQALQLRAFQLDDAYCPQPPLFQWRQPVRLDSANPRHTEQLGFF